MQRKVSTEITVRDYSNNADTLRRVMDSVPDGATYDLHTHEGDRPWESGYYTLTFNWMEEL